MSMMRAVKLWKPSSLKIFSKNNWEIDDPNSDEPDECNKTLEAFIIENIL